MTADWRPATNLNRATTDWCGNPVNTKTLKKSITKSPMSTRKFVQGKTARLTKFVIMFKLRGW